MLQELFQRAGLRHQLADRSGWSPKRALRLALQLVHELREPEVAVGGVVVVTGESRYLVSWGPGLHVAPG